MLGNLTIQVNIRTEGSVLSHCYVSVKVMWMEKSLAEIIKELAEGIDEYNIPDWISFSAICREIDKDNVYKVIHSIPERYIDAFYVFIDESPRTDEEWSNYTVIGGGISSGSDEEISRKNRYRCGVEIVRRYIKSDET